MAEFPLDPDGWDVPLKSDHTPLTDEEKLDLLRIEVQRLGAILRDYHMHDPECPARGVEKAQRYTSAYLVRPACACWLAEESP